jgi:hypothetical protein
MSKTRLYSVWFGMKRRCTNHSDKSYPNYGGRGIKICGEWLHDFRAFADWAYGSGYREDLSIERIDNNGDYRPENCRWIPMIDQVKNRRCSKFYFFAGRQMLLPEIAQVSGIHKDTLSYRLRRGDDIETAVSRPLRPTGRPPYTKMDQSAGRT